MTFIYGDRKALGSVSIDGHLGIFPIIHYPPPGILRDLAQSSSNWIGTKLTTKIIHPKNPNRWDDHRTKTVEQTMHYDTDSLGRMLAKIAYVAAVGQFGFEQFDSWLLPDKVS